MNVTVDWAGMIMREIADSAMGRRQVAQTYGYLITTGHREWGDINRAILSRWGKSGLEWIKKQAWKQAKDEHKGEV